MLKKQLSSNLIAEKTIVISALVITSPFWLVVNEFPAISIILVLILILCVYSLYTVFYVVSNVSYDDSHLYIIHRKQQKSIELKEIIQIKLTPYWGSWRSQWKIKYIENGNEQQIFFYLKYGLLSLRPFIKTVKIQNPSVDYVYIILDVDFD